jgi:hypothetical protein
VKRVAFVVSEHRDGLTPARVARFARARKRLAEVATAEVDAIHYADVERLDVDRQVGRDGAGIVLDAEHVHMRNGDASQARQAADRMA